MVDKAAAIGLQHDHINGFLRAMQRLPNVELVAVAEAEARVREKYVREFGVPGYASARELLRKHDVSIVGAAPIHADAGDIVCTALKAGAHVVMDKPVHSLKQHEAVAKAVADTGKQFWLMLTVRYSADARAMKAIARSGRLGRFVNFLAFRPHKLTVASRPDWMFDPAKYSGVIVDLGVHDLDALRWATGEEVTEVAAYHSNLRFTDRPGFTDNGEVLCRTQSGGTALIRADWLTPDASPMHGDCRFLLVGTEGYVEVRPAKDILGKEQAPVTLCTNTTPPEAVAPLKAKRGFYEDFLAACAGASDTELTTADSLRSSELALRAREAAETGKKLLL
jgi:predicted dehydrogenase